MATILLIDDDPGVRKLLEWSLAREGHDVHSATDGLEGLEKFRTCQPDLVITDLYMPEMEGIEMFKQMRVERPEVAVIVISGGAMMDAGGLLGMARRLGATLTFNKPFGVRDLLNGVEEALSLALRS